MPNSLEDAVRAVTPEIPKLLYKAFTLKEVESWRELLSYIDGMNGFLPRIDNTEVEA